MKIPILIAVIISVVLAVAIIYPLTKSIEDSIENRVGTDPQAPAADQGSDSNSGDAAQDPSQDESGAIQDAEPMSPVLKAMFNALPIVVVVVVALGAIVFIVGVAGGDAASKSVGTRYDPPNLADIQEDFDRYLNSVTPVPVPVLSVPLATRNVETRKYWCKFCEREALNPEFRDIETGTMAKCSRCGREMIYSMDGQAVEDKEPPRRQFDFDADSEWGYKP